MRLFLPAWRKTVLGMCNQHTQPEREGKAHLPVAQAGGPGWGRQGDEGRPGWGMGLAFLFLSIHSPEHPEQGKGCQDAQALHPRGPLPQAPSLKGLDPTVRVCRVQKGADPGLGGSGLTCAIFLAANS